MIFLLVFFVTAIDVLWRVGVIGVLTATAHWLASRYGIGFAVGGFLVLTSFSWWWLRSAHRLAQHTGETNAWAVLRPLPPSTSTDPAPQLERYPIYGRLFVIALTWAGCVWLSVDVILFATR